MHCSHSRASPLRTGSHSLRGQLHCSGAFFEGGSISLSKISPLTCNRCGARQQLTVSHHRHSPTQQGNPLGVQRSSSRPSQPCRCRAVPSHHASSCRHIRRWGQHGARGGAAHPSYRCSGMPQLQGEFPMMISVGSVEGGPTPPVGMQELLQALEGGNTQEAYKAFKRMRQLNPGAALPGATTCERLLQGETVVLSCHSDKRAWSCGHQVYCVCVWGGGVKAVQADSLVGEGTKTAELDGYGECCLATPCGGSLPGLVSWEGTLARYMHDLLCSFLAS